MKIKFGVFALLLISMVSLSSALVEYSTFQAPPASFQSYYSSSDLNMMWPSLSDPATCKARQDIVLQVAPAGCSPMVVRSDLLAEQNVPVFCQIMGLQINPLIDVKSISNLRFKGTYPKEVAGIGFHPAMAAIRTRDQLSGSPLINNIGYVVVILKKTPNEKDLPKFVNATMTAQIEYTAGNALGIGRAQFLLTETSDLEWQDEKLKQSFWDGKYAVRLESADDNSAAISLYHNQNKITTIRVDKSKPAREIYLPGTYCQVALQVYYDGFESTATKAILEVSNDNGVDKLAVYEKSVFINDKCRVNKINPAGGGFGSAEIICNSDKFTLSTAPMIKLNQEVKVNVSNKWIESAKIVEILPNLRYKVAYTEGKENKIIEAVYKEIIPIVSEEGAKAFLEDKSSTADADKKFSDAIAAYMKVVQDYPSERINTDGAPDANGFATYGEEALAKAILLAKEFNKKKTEYELMSKFVELYPGSLNAENYRKAIGEIYKVDSSSSSISVSIDNKYRVIRLLSVDEQKQKPSAEVVLGGSAISLAEGSSTPVKGGVVILEKVEKEQIRISTNCKGSQTKNIRTSLRAGNGSAVCEDYLKFERANLEQLAKIRIIPETKGTQMETNISVTIGIEKRAIKLSTDKKKDMIANINKSIEKWESISNRLGKIVKTMKSACLATSAILTFKNFAAGLSGEALARQQVMNGDNGWKKVCRQEASEKGITMSECYSNHADDIKKDVDSTKNAIDKANSKIKAIESQTGISAASGGVLGDKSVNSDKAKAELANVIRSEYGQTSVKTSSGETMQVSQLLDDKNLNSISYAEMRDMYMNLERSNSGSSVQQKNVQGLLDAAGSRISSNIKLQQEYDRSKELALKGLPRATPLQAVKRTEIPAEVVKSNTLGSQVSFYNPIQSEYASFVVDSSGSYILGLEKPQGSDKYVVKEVFKENKTAKMYVLLTDEEAAKFTAGNGVGLIRQMDAVSYRNKILKPEVRYYETEPYKGMPAIVPFDTTNGWYAGTRQTLPTFGGIGAYDASGRVTSFWLCNVGKNGRIEFDEGFGDDICQLVNLNTGQTLSSFPGMRDDEAGKLVQRAIKALQDAQGQYGNKVVRIGSESFSTGVPMANIPDTQCEDFMSPGDCATLFNLCDPVICPSSRCNLGGAYNVPDVIQSGVIGSVVLCLPNFGSPFKGGVAIPVCLTGIEAGIDSYVSILKNHRDCLQQSIDKGTMSGICDQIYSIYTCEFFWRQIGPFLNNLIPKVVSYAYGQTGTRGGGEYMTVQSAWDNADKSFKYFTQTYGINSFKAFQGRSIADVGGAFCKAYVSASGPKGIKSMIEPDSPPQYSAWFDATRFTTATLPATSQYKVFYHIFAGKNDGVYFNVYLRNPPESSYYSYNPTVAVASGFIAKGQYASETKDFTAPEGYKELCININGEDKCGFKQVSTDFGVNYLRDQYVSNELEKKNIVSEQECISGSPSVGSLMANTNPMSAVQQAAMPEIYNRGVIRLCSSANPGSSTDSTRFIEVGYCSDQKIRCWLDKSSVKNSLTPYAEKLANDTLKNLGADVLKQQIEDPNALNEEINSLNDKKEALKKDNALDAIKIKTVLDSIDLLSARLTLNNQKAKLLFIKSEVFEIDAKSAKSKAPADIISRASPTNAANTASPATQTSSAQTPEIFKFALVGLEIYAGKGSANPATDTGLSLTLHDKTFLIIKNNKKVGTIEEEGDITFLPSVTKDQYMADLETNYMFDSSSKKFILGS